MQSANNFNQQQDQISIQSNNGDTVLSYSWSNSKKQLSIDVSNVSKVQIRYSGKGDDPQVPVEFSQPMQSKIVLKVGPEGKQQVYQRLQSLAFIIGLSSRNQAAPSAAFGALASQLEIVRISRYSGS